MDYTQNHVLLNLRGPLGNDYGSYRRFFDEKADRECDDTLTEITEDTNVGKLLKAYPESLKILVRYGFSLLEDPIMRRTLVKTITLKQAKMLIGMSDYEFKKMLEELRALIQNP